MECSYGQTMKAAANAVDVCEWKRVSVRAICKQNKDSFVLLIDPAARPSEARVSKTFPWKVESGGGVFCFRQLPTKRPCFLQALGHVRTKQLAGLAFEQTSLTGQKLTG